MRCGAYISVRVEANAIDGYDCGEGGGRVSLPLSLSYFPPLSFLRLANFDSVTAGGDAAAAAEGYEET